MKLRTVQIDPITAPFLVGTPLAALVWGALRLTTVGIRPFEAGLLVAGFAATGFAITAGYHRLFAHGAYECHRAVKILWLLLGAAAFEQSVLVWSADHRRHHASIDEAGDPYNIRRGFFWAHIGWMLAKRADAPDLRNVPDLSADPWIRAQHRFYVPTAVLTGFGVPWLLGWAAGDPWGGLLWGGLVRMVLVHHATFCINSLAHTIGARPYSLSISARDSAVTALATLGEGYHNFHHCFATDYRNGIRRRHWDPTKWLIRVLAAIGLAWDLRRTPREKIVAAELACDTARLDARAAAALAGIRDAVQASAARLGALERAIRRSAGQGGSMAIRAELRAARRELRAQRRRWRSALAAPSAA